MTLLNYTITARNLCKSSKVLILRGKKETRRFGFTLIEMLVVMAVVASLSTMAIYLVSKSYFNKAKIAQAQNDLQTIRTAMIAYRADFDELPPNGHRDPPKDFCNFPEQFCYQSTYPAYNYPNAWKNDIVPEIAPYMSKKVEVDPWGREYYFDNNYHFNCKNSWSYICSAGPDGLLESIGEGGFSHPPPLCGTPGKSSGDDICVFIDDDE